MNLARAIDLAQTSPADEFKIAAIGYDKRGRVVSTGINQPTKSHPTQAKYARLKGEQKRINLHAEISCLVRSKKQVHYLKIVRVRPGTRVLKASHPCHICMLAIENAGVRFIEYFDGDNWFLRDLWNEE